ncbi:MAG: phosphoenolpyruvate--protein phosphotransferase [Kiritimatiellia bacterium]
MTTPAAIKKTDSAAEIVLRGIGVSSGIVHGRVFLKPAHDDAPVERPIAKDDIPREIARFENALIATRRQIKDFQAKCDPAVASIFDAHLLILDDRPFIERVFLGIESQLKNVEAVLHAVAGEFIQNLKKVNDNYVRERAADVHDVTRRILHNLAGHEGSLADLREKGTIIVASDLTPSEIVSLNQEIVSGIALDLGSPTAHTAILAAKRGIPAVVGLHDITRATVTGDMLLIDGNKGIAAIHPSRERCEDAFRQADLRRSIVARLEKLRELPAETRDGYRVTLSANIEGPKDVEMVLQSGAEGVGLFRTEYFYMEQNKMPTEDEQFEAYREVAKRLSPGPVVIRTLDLGGDKFLPDMDKASKESNPFMGWRAIRFCLAQPDMFRTQMRAILRASVYGNVKVMYPMISNLDELVRANVIFEQTKKELIERGQPVNPNIEVGAMIEVPSAAMAADALAPHVRFFSLGTNDLIQYTLAIDRGNERVAYLYEPTHISILRLIKQTIDVGHHYTIWTGICGGMASDPLLVPLLLGMGIDELSVNPASLPIVKDAIRSVSYSQCRKIAEMALNARHENDIEDNFRALAKKVAPEILEFVN